MKKFKYLKIYEDFKILKSQEAINESFFGKIFYNIKSFFKKKSEAGKILKEFLSKIGLSGYSNHYEVMNGSLNPQNLKSNIFSNPNICKFISIEKNEDNHCVLKLSSDDEFILDKQCIDTIDWVSSVGSKTYNSLDDLLSDEFGILLFDPKSVIIRKTIEIDFSAEIPKMEFTEHSYWDFEKESWQEHVQSNQVSESVANQQTSPEEVEQRAEAIESIISGKPTQQMIIQSQFNKKGFEVITVSEWFDKFNKVYGNLLKNETPKSSDELSAKISQFLLKHKLNYKFS